MTGPSAPYRTGRLEGPPIDLENRVLRYETDPGCLKNPRMLKTYLRLKSLNGRGFCPFSHLRRALMD